MDTLTLLQNIKQSKLILHHQDRQAALTIRFFFEKEHILVYIVNKSAIGKPSGIKTSNPITKV